MRSIINAFLVFYSILVFTGCSKEKNSLNTENLIGIWYHEDILEEDNRISRLQYNFMEEGAFEMMRIEYEKSSGGILGYGFRSVGTYQLSDDQLTFYFQKYYVNDDPKDYTELENLRLVYAGEEDLTTWLYRFEDEGEKLILTSPGPCPPNAICVGSITLMRE